MRCNLCDADPFPPKDGGTRLICDVCHSYERTRLLWLYIDRMMLGPATRVLHIAPERGLHAKLSARLSAENYVTADLFPEKYPFADNIRRMDLCDLDREQSEQYDLIVHCHVLEHTPCSIGYTLHHLHRMLRTTGKHVCVVPFMQGRWDESFADLSREEKTERFGQFDHVRRFGADDVGAHLGAHLRLPADFDATRDFPETTLREAAIPQGAWRGFGINTVLVLSKDDYRL